MVASDPIRGDNAGKSLEMWRQVLLWQYDDFSLECGSLNISFVSGGLIGTVEGNKHCTTEGQENPNEECDQWSALSQDITRRWTGQSSVLNFRSTANTRDPRLRTVEKEQRGGGCAGTGRGLYRENKDIKQNAVDGVDDVDDVDAVNDAYDVDAIDMKMLWIL
ncbi:hypothetical protein RRG08_023507 [Elysia crispata]|uniref:Uncharacterized protein n=1 Tax=Elysia crispata TaxID=231223 RepID=A0AAE1D6N4_9GAST|nr:hypothetical protein RRG08_023507 [Elysia crispata]